MTDLIVFYVDVCVYVVEKTKKIEYAKARSWLHTTKQLIKQRRVWL